MVHQTDFQENKKKTRQRQELEITAHELGEAQAAKRELEEEAIARRLENQEVLERMAHLEEDLSTPCPDHERRSMEEIERLAAELKTMAVARCDSLLAVKQGVLHDSRQLHRKSAAATAAADAPAAGSLRSTSMREAAASTTDPTRPGLLSSSPVSAGAGGVAPKLQAELAATTSPGRPVLADHAKATVGETHCLPPSWFRALRSADDLAFRKAGRLRHVNVD